MKKIALFLTISSVITFGQVPNGYVLVPWIGGGTIVRPTLSTYLASWQQTFENQSIASLVNQGDNSPTAINNEVLAVANTFAQSVSNATGPDVTPAAILLTIAPIQQVLDAAASTVPASQWSLQTYNPHACTTLALCAAVAAIQPPPSVGPLVNLPCSTVCTAGSGVTSATAMSFVYNNVTYPNGTIIAFAGISYVAHTYQGLFGASVWFSPVQTTAEFVAPPPCPGDLRPDNITNPCPTEPPRPRCPVFWPFCTDGYVAHQETVEKFDPPTPTCYPCPDSNFAAIKYDSIFA